MNKIIKALFFFCLLLSQQLFADPPIKVGIVGEPPFVISRNQQPAGFVVDIWDRIAEKNHIAYQLIPMGTDVNAALVKMNAGSVDMTIGNIAVVSERLKDYIFSRPIFVNELAVVTTGKPENFFDIIKIVIAPFLQTVSIIFLCVLFIFSFIHCYCEYRTKQNPMNIKNFFKSFWVIIAAILAVSYPEWPHTAFARILSLFTLLLGLTFTVIFSAAVTTSMTISSSDLSLNANLKPDSFANKNIAVIQGSYAFLLLKSLNAHIIPVKNFNEGIERLRQHQVVAFFDNYATVKNSWDQSLADLNYSKFLLGRNEVAFAFPPNSPLLRSIDITLTSLQETNDIYQICAKYLDPISTKNCII